MPLAGIRPPGKPDRVDWQELAGNPFWQAERVGQGRALPLRVLPDRRVWVVGLRTPRHIAGQDIRTEQDRSTGPPNRRPVICTFEEKMSRE